MDLVKYGHRVIKEINSPEMTSIFYSLPSFFGKLTFARRLQKGLTQDELAALMGVEPRIIHQIEGGSFKISMSQYEKVFSLLGITYYEVADAIIEIATKFDEA